MMMKPMALLCCDYYTDEHLARIVKFEREEELQSLSPIRPSFIRRTYYPDGKTLASEYTVIEGKKEYSFSRFYDSGKLMAHGTYVNDKLDGKYSTFDIDGTPVTKENFVRGVRHGLFIRFDEKGNVNEEIPYYYGHVNGIVKRFLSDGFLLCEESYVFDLKNGTSKTYSPLTRNIEEVCDYRFGQRQGDRIVYYACFNGEHVSMKCHYENGYLEGECVTFFVNGQAETRGNFEYGLRIGVHEIFNISGNLVSSITYKDCTKTGEASFYNVDGSLLKRCIFDHDVEVQRLN